MSWGKAIVCLATSAADYRGGRGETAHRLHSVFAARGGVGILGET